MPEFDRDDNVQVTFDISRDLLHDLAQLAMVRGFDLPEAINFVLGRWSANQDFGASVLDRLGLEVVEG